MNYIVTINNKKYEVEVDRGQVAVVSTTDVSSPAAAPRADYNAAPALQASPAEPVGNGEMIKAPMPGTLLDVKISAGAKAKKGQVIFILEAMKMENEILSPIDGTVAQIRAAKGSSVSAGDILAVIQQ